MLLIICIFFNIFHQCLIIFLSVALLHPWLNFFEVFYFSETIVSGIIFLVSIFNSSLLVYKNATDYCPGMVAQLTVTRSHAPKAACSIPFQGV